MVLINDDDDDDDDDYKEDKDDEDKCTNTHTLKLFYWTQIWILVTSLNDEDDYEQYNIIYYLFIIIYFIYI